LHSHAHLVAARFSSSNPNIQQIPKNKASALRRCFVAAPGMQLVISDYNAMELRAAAAIAGDTAMNFDFANGVDPHRRQAAETLGIPQSEVTAQQWNATKPICFGTIYGAGNVASPPLPGPTTTWCYRRMRPKRREMPFSRATPTSRPGWPAATHSPIVMGALPLVASDG